MHVCMHNHTKLGGFGGMLPQADVVLGHKQSCGRAGSLLPSALARGSE